MGTYSVLQPGTTKSIRNFPSPEEAAMFIVDLEEKKITTGIAVSPHREAINAAVVAERLKRLSGAEED